MWPVRTHNPESHSQCDIHLSQNHFQWTEFPSYLPNKMCWLERIRIAHCHVITMLWRHELCDVTAYDATGTQSHRTSIGCLVCFFSSRRQNIRKTIRNVHSQWERRACYGMQWLQTCRDLDDINVANATVSACYLKAIDYTEGYLFKRKLFKASGA